MTTRSSHFLADPSPEAAISPTLSGEAYLTLKRNRVPNPASQTTDQIVEVLSYMGEDWFQPDSPRRELAPADGSRCAGFDRATLERGLGSSLTSLARKSLRTWLTQELGAPRRFDDFTIVPGEATFLRAAIATGPEFLADICANNRRNATKTGMVLGLLTRPAQFVKCASGPRFSPGSSRTRFTTRITSTARSSKPPNGAKAKAPRRWQNLFYR